MYVCMAEVMNELETRYIYIYIHSKQYIHTYMHAGNVFLETVKGLGIFTNPAYVMMVKKKVDPLSYFSIQPVSTTSVTKAVVCAILIWDGVCKIILAGGSGVPLAI